MPGHEFATAFVPYTGICVTWLEQNLGKRIDRSELERVFDEHDRVSCFSSSGVPDKTQKIINALKEALFGGL